MAVVIKPSIPELHEIEQKLGDKRKETPKVLSRALNRAITHSRTLMVKEASKRVVKIKQKAIRKTITIRKSTYRNLVGNVLSVSDSRIPLIDFKVSPDKPNPQWGFKAMKGKRPRFYKSKVLKKSGFKKLAGGSIRVKGKSYEGSAAFVAQLKSGHVGVFERLKGTNMDSKGYKERLTQLYGPSIPQIIASESAMNVILRETDAKLKERIDHEVRYVLTK